MSENIKEEESVDFERTSLSEKEEEKRKMWLNLIFIIAFAILFCIVGIANIIYSFFVTHFGQVYLIFFGIAFIGISVITYFAAVRTKLKEIKLLAP